MATISATANPGKNNSLSEPRTVSIEFNLGENLKESVKLFSETIVHSKSNQSITVDIQGILRRLAANGQTDEQIQAYFNNVNYNNPEKEPTPWLPGIAPARKSAEDKLMDLWNKMSPEQQAAFASKAGKK